MKKYELMLCLKDYYASKSTRLIEMANRSKSQEDIGLRWTTYALIRLFQKVGLADTLENKFYGN